MVGSHGWSIPLVIPLIPTIGDNERQNRRQCANNQTDQERSERHFGPLNR